MRVWRSLPVVLALTGCLQATPQEHARAQTLVEAAAASSAGVFDVADPSAFDRVVAVSDVHGMFAPLVRVLDAAGVIDGHQRWAGGRTLLVVVGDSIDKGPDTLDVLDLWQALADQAAATGGRVVHVLGNHEAEFLASNGTDDKADDLLAELKAKHVPVSDLLDPSRPRGAFLAGMPLAARVGRWLFCHAGLCPSMPWADFKAKANGALSHRAYGDSLLAGDNSILEAKDWWKDGSTRRSLEARMASEGLFGIVQGHQPKAYGLEGRIGAIDGGHLVKIDCGVPPEGGGNPAEVLVFPKAAELAKDAFPDALVVREDGKSKPLTPEGLGD